MRKVALALTTVIAITCAVDANAHMCGTCVKEKELHDYAVSKLNLTTGWVYLIGWKAIPTTVLLKWSWKAGSLMLKKAEC